MLEADIRELIVDEDGLDVLYWKKLKNINGSIHEHPTVRVKNRKSDWNLSAVRSGGSSSSRGQRSGGRSSGGAFPSLADPGGGVGDLNSPAVPDGSSSFSRRQLLRSQGLTGRSSGVAFKAVAYSNGVVGDWNRPTDLGDRSSSGQLLPGQRFDGWISGVALQDSANSGGGVGVPLHASANSGGGVGVSLPPPPGYQASSSTAILTASALSSTAVGDKSSSAHGQLLPGQRFDGWISGVAPQASANSGGGVGVALQASGNTGGGFGFALQASTNPAGGYRGPPQASANPGGGLSVALQASANPGSGFGVAIPPPPGYQASSSTAILTAPAASSTAASTAPSSYSTAVPTAPAPTPAAPSAPAPPPPAPAKKAPPPPPPPAPAKKAPMAPPPPPPKAGGHGPLKPPAPPKRPSSGSKTSEAEAKEGSSGSGTDQVMLKPLHWEKLNVNPEHSMVWDKIERGSFQYSEDKMEALFGFVPSSRKSGMEDNPNSKSSEVANANTKVFILDPRKSRNTAIVLKSLGTPRGELIDSLLEGKGLSIETLEKLQRTVPTREEESEILAFDGDPAKLADAESFLYSLLKVVPLAYTRASTMLFRLNYKSEILNVKELLQPMEPACSELRSSGLFLKLLEAILKAGNRLNAGTARGGAKAFNLTTLLKLSDFKSSDGKTTLLSFVVHEVIRNEGRRSILAAKKDTATKNDADSAAPKPNDPVEKEEKEMLRLGLPVVSCLSAEFLNVKKVASMDYDVLKSSIASLKKRLDETRQLVSKCRSSGGGGGFLKEMEGFLESAEVEMKALQEENTRVMDLVTKTTQYFQAGSSNKNPLQLFIIVKDFLGMVDQTCAEIARALQPKKPAPGATSGSSSSTQQDVLRTRVIFPGLKEHILLVNKSKLSNSSDSEDDF